MTVTRAGNGSGDHSGEKLAATVARQIERDVVDRGWPVGEVLGSELELLHRYGVSRAVLREAIKLVEQHQVAAMRAGRGGGLVVKAPAAASVAESIALYLDLADVSGTELFEARLCLELFAVQLAAERITERGIRRLRQVLDEEQREPGATLQAVFYAALGEVAGNPALTIFIDALTTATHRLGGLRLRVAHALDEPDVHQYWIAHRAIAEAVIGGDGALAQHRVRRHLEAWQAWIGPDSLARPSPDPLPLAAVQARYGKLSEAVALALRDEIHRRGWPIGEVLGSEAELMARYGVSRAVLREAVRILEHNGVAHTRRGPGGGLAVQTPDPSRVVDAVTLYLDYIGIDARHLHDARRAIELTTVELAAARIDDAGRELLRAVEAAERAPSPHQPPPSFHAAVSELAGNRALTLFVRVLVALTRSQVSPGHDQGARMEAQLAVHARIAEAITQGDPGLARHRMMRHLGAINPWLSRWPAEASESATR